VYSKSVCIKTKKRNRLNKYEQRADIQGIYASFVAKYGVSSNEVKNIVGIAKSVDVTWIIKYVKVPEGMVGDYGTVNKREVLIEDAGIEAGDYAGSVTCQVQHGHAKSATTWNW